MPTTVISVRGKRRDELLADPRFLYVGRRVLWAAWPGSAWGNPWRARDFDGGAAACVEHFREALEAMVRALPQIARARRGEIGWPTDEVLRALDPQDFERLERMAVHLPDLRGKTLGCWCCNWDGTGEPSAPCHAVVLAKMADGPHGDPR